MAGKDKANGVELGRGGEAEETRRPIHPLLWNFMLLSGVGIYGTYSIFIHLCEVDGKLPFSSASAVLLVEIFKLVISLSFLAPDIRARKVPWPSLAIAMPFAVPAILYSLNNNISVHMQLQMDPATYQVLSNMKILSTAFLYRLIIKRPISTIQWVALGLLVLAGGSNSYGGFQAKAGTSSAGVIHITLQGLLMIAAYCTLSGLAGVYTEYILKKKYDASLHLQNALLYSFGILLNGSSWLYGAATSSEPDSFHLLKGYTIYTWLFIATQVAIGLIMSVIFKHGNNITRLFVISCAMLVTTVLSMLIFGLVLNMYFVVSFVLVVLALCLYHSQ